LVAGSPFEIVCIGSSSGGLSALTEVLGALPPDFPAAVVVAHHRGQPDLSPGIFVSRVRLPVTTARAGEHVRAGTVTVAPPAPQVVIGTDGVITFEAADRCVADPLFTSSASFYGRRTIGVVLTGRLDDGATGACAIARAGGRVLVQDPRTAAAPGMPRAAIATGCVDFILPLAKIAPALVALTMVPGAADLFEVRRPAWARVA
jgi:two-component system chemotaxis response regulator CheB